MMLKAMIAAACLWTIPHAATVTGGIVSADVTWTDTITVTDDVILQDGVLLTIAPGTVVEGIIDSNGYKTILVKGTGGIRALGEDGNPVHMNKIRIEFSGITRDSVNRLQYCSFAQGGGEFIRFHNPGDIMVFPDAFIENCTFTGHNWTHIYVLRGNSPTIRNCTFDGAGTGVFIHGGKDVDISNSVFMNTSCGIFGASIQSYLMAWEPGTITVDHCAFYNITGTRAYLDEMNGYGICTMNCPETLRVTNSIFYTVDSSGIRNYGIEDPDNEPWVVYNDYNCYYGCSNGPCRLFDAGPNSMIADPLFADPVGNDFSLQSGSPCTGAASDGSDMGLVFDSNETTPIITKIERSTSTDIVVHRGGIDSLVYSDSLHTYIHYSHYWIMSPDSVKSNCNVLDTSVVAFINGALYRSIPYEQNGLDWLCACVNQTMKGIIIADNDTGFTATWTVGAWDSLDAVEALWSMIDSALTYNGAANGINWPGAGAISTGHGIRDSGVLYQLDGQVVPGAGRRGIYVQCGPDGVVRKRAVVE